MYITVSLSISSRKGCSWINHMIIRYLWCYQSTDELTIMVRFIINSNNCCHFIFFKRRVKFRKPLLWASYIRRENTHVLLFFFLYGAKKKKHKAKRIPRVHRGPGPCTETRVLGLGPSGSVRRPARTRLRIRWTGFTTSRKHPRNSPQKIKIK